ncbi:endolytic transglycosylase MltG [Candidatus Kaiserbacteria bacterium]|nr:endolytic transglycosylase MltG [Candidatus Kaiserbacteria bacterium]
MQDFRKSLEQFFDSGSEWLLHISERWRVHANRRTTLAFIFGGTTLITLYIAVVQPPDRFPLDTLVSIPEGATLSETADSLASESVVRSGFALKFLLVVSGKQDDIHAGDYLFKEPKNMFVVARAIVTGAYGLEPTRIRVPEGATSMKIAKIFGSQLERFDEERFIRAAQPLEGSLFPDTYFFLPNATDELVLQTLRQNFDAHLATIAGQIESFGKPLEDVIIMASLLEREAENSEDRRKIAGVLWNRLEKGMLLQVDAAFIYSLGKGSFELTNAELTDENDPYNTYVHKGLPPGAIGSPSLDSLLAAVTPTDHEYFYYLADRNHVTHYSKTYQEHLRLKRKYLGS